jgi:hypothetical protein
MTKLDYSQDSSIKIEALQNQLAEVSQSARSLATRLAVAKATLSDIATCRGVSSANSAEALAWAMNYAKEAVDDINAETESAALYSAQPSLDANLLLHRKALSVAMRYLAPLQPGDSRAVDDWFVACAAVQCDLTDHDGAIERCLDAAMLYPEPQRPEPVVVTYQTAPDATPTDASPAQETEAKVAALMDAAKALHADMLERAELKIDHIRGEQYRIVNAGNTAWSNFCAALDAWEDQT